MSTGQESEDAAEDILSRAGFETWTPPKAKFRAQDVLNLYDIVAAHPARQLHLVQVKTSAARGIRSWSEDVRDTVGLEAAASSMMVRYPGEGWRVLEPTHGGHRTVYDGRSLDAPVGDPVVEVFEG
mgnify:CR=1 FL=1